MKAFFGAVCIYAVLGNLSTAQAANTESGSQGSTKFLMQEFLSQMTALKKFLVSEESFVDPKNGPEISGHLKKFREAAQKANHEPMLATENFKFSKVIFLKQSVSLITAINPMHAG